MGNSNSRKESLQNASAPAKRRIAGERINEGEPPPRPLDLAYPDADHKTAHSWQAQGKFRGEREGGKGKRQFPGSSWANSESRPSLSRTRTEVDMLARSLGKGGQSPHLGSERRKELMLCF